MTRSARSVVTRVDAVGLEDLPYGRRSDVDSQAGQLAVDPAYPHSGFSLASRRTSALMFRRVAGRPVLPRLDLAARRRRAMSRCQRRIVSGMTSSRSPCAALSVSRRAGPRAVPGPSRSGGGGAAAAVAGRRAGGAGSRSRRSAMPPHAGDSRSHVIIRVMRRKANRRHMTGNRDGQAAGKTNPAGQSGGRDSRHAQVRAGPVLAVGWGRPVVPVQALRLPPPLGGLTCSGSRFRGQRSRWRPIRPPTCLASYWPLMIRASCEPLGAVPGSRSA
jgi:hypothetical protein